MMKKDKRNSSAPQDPEKGRGFLNIMKMIILVAVLVGAWFLLDWLISGK
jgi:hypothetical protein